MMFRILLFVATLFAAQAALGATLTIRIVASNINLTVTASTQWCTAPCGVLFSTVGTTSATGVTSYPWSDIQCTWNFGDDDTALWTTGSHVGDGTALAKKNRAAGPLAAHVYETASGTPYTATATCTDGTNTATGTVAITVADPDVTWAGTATMCIANGSLPVAGAGGCPSGADVRNGSGDFDQDMGACATGNTKRCLFKRGDTFTASAAITVGTLTTIYVGAYGSGDKPIIVKPDTIKLFTFNSTGSVWKLVDLNLQGPATSDQGTGGGMLFNTAGTATDVVVLRVDATGAGLIGTTDGTNWRQLFVQDSSNSLWYGGNFSYLIGSQSAFLGNNLGPIGMVYNAQVSGTLSGTRTVTLADTAPLTAASYTGTKSRLKSVQSGINTSNTYVVSIDSATQITVSADHAATGVKTLEFTDAEHIIRVQLCKFCVFSSNTATGPSATKHAFTLRAFPFTTEANDSYYNVISDNKFISGVGAVNTATIAPSSETEDQHIYNAIFERNWTQGGATAQYGIAIQSFNITVRNNVFDISGNTGAGGISISNHNRNFAGQGFTNKFPVVSNVQVLNNTIYGSDPTSGRAVDLGQGSSWTNSIANTVVKNNLYYVPSDASGDFINESAGATGGTTIGAGGTYGNSSDAQADDSPLFTSVSPFTPANAMPTAGSYAINGGTSVPVWSDFGGNALTGTREIGAWQF